MTEALVTLYVDFPGKVGLESRPGHVASPSVLEFRCLVHVTEYCWVYYCVRCMHVKLRALLLVRQGTTYHLDRNAVGGFAPGQTPIS